MTKKIKDASLGGTLVFLAPLQINEFWNVKLKLCYVGKMSFGVGVGQVM